MNKIILVLLFMFTVENKGKTTVGTTVTSEGVTSNNGSTQGSQLTSNQEISSTSTEELTSSATSTLKPNSLSISYGGVLTVTSSSTMNANTSYNNNTTVQPTNPPPQIGINDDVGLQYQSGDLKAGVSNDKDLQCLQIVKSSTEFFYSNFFNYMDLRTILIFMLGVIFSTVIFSVVLCVVSVCIRCRNTDANTDKEGIILEAVKSEHDQSVMQSDEHQADEQVPLQVHSPVSTNTSTLNGGTDEEMKVFEKEQTEGLGVVNELDYASINYSLLQKKDDGDSMPQKVESDYAEIQLKKPSEGEKVETLPDGERQEELKQDGVDQDLDSEMVSQKDA